MDDEAKKFVDASMAALRTDVRFAVRSKLENGWDAVRRFRDIDPSVNVLFWVGVIGLAAATLAVLIRAWRSRSSDKLRAAAGVTIAVAAVWLESIWSWT